MKSNLTKEDYIELIDNCNEPFKSIKEIIIENDKEKIKGQIYSQSVKLDKYYDISGNVIIPKKYGFVIKFNNYVADMFEKNKIIIIDNIKYFLGDWTYCNNYDFQFKLISYDLYTLEDFN